MAEIFEFRFYSVSPGRMKAEHALLHDMGIAGAPETPGGPPFHPESLWDRYGVPRPAGTWTVLAGRQTPGVVYLMRWESMKQRDANFPRFWTDPFWRARRAELTDGHTLVDSIETWLLDPNAAWPRFGLEMENGPVGGVHEMRVQNILNGSQADAAEVLATVDLPALQALGARLLGVFEVVIGPGRPRFVTFLAWPDIETQERAWFEMDRNETVLAQRARERERYGRMLFSGLDPYLLEPVKWNMPNANFGLSELGGLR
jgi:hypothetical protein